jgi:high-affinity nickel-transport protein
VPLFIAICCKYPPVEVGSQDTRCLPAAARGQEKRIVELLQAAQAGGAALLGTALALGVRHGIDWDHIAAIADITSTTTGAEATAPPAGQRKGLMFGEVELRALFLASMYALGHAAVVAVLGVLALYFQAILPEWIDPLMERVVGVTLLLLGFWVFYSLYAYWRGGPEFQLRSRWMLLFAAIRHGWHWLQHKVGGHEHNPSLRVDQYGPRTAFGIGMIHGVGAETGSQVLLIAAVGGAAAQGLGTGMMVAFIVGLLISNTVVAFLSATGFISSSRAKSLYVAVGTLAGAFSLVVGAYFVLGAGDRLPDLQQLMGFGAEPG